MRPNFSARKQSSIINLRTFHNWTKRELLNQTCSTIKSELDQPITLLDLSCGVGGDMSKWYDNGIMSVVGFDINSESIDEARSRYAQLIQNLRRKNIKNLPTYEFHVSDLSDSNNLSKIAAILKQKKFNIVSCQFAIHYFFRDEASLFNLITIVDSYISNYGFFIGTTVNGYEVVTKLHNNSSIGNGIYTIEKKYTEPISNPYNNTILVSLGESQDTEHYFANKKSEEYIVDIELLKNVCSKMNLIFVGTIDFETWYKTFKKNIMSQDEMEYSFLNFSFVFKKIVV